MISKLKKSEKGQALVEFALVLPILLMLLCGIIDMGWLFFNSYQVEDAAYDGVRYAVINGADVEDSGKTQLINDTKQCVIDSLGKGNSNVTVTVKVDTDDVTVNVKYKIKMLTFVGQVMFGEYYDADSTSVGARIK